MIKDNGKKSQLKKPKISVIIPCYNEEERIIPVIKEAKKSEYVKEIIVVDDGSEEETKNLLEKIEDITVLRNKENLGKSAALGKGVNKAKFDIVVFIDADLKNFKYENIDLLAKTLIKKNYDMVLGICEKDVFYMQWIGFTQAFTGERAIKKNVLLRHKEIFEQKDYLIEPAMNKVFFHNYKIGAVYLENVEQTYKILKSGIRGLLKDFKMYYEHIQYLGKEEFMYQLRFGKQITYKTTDN